MIGVLLLAVVVVAALTATVVTVRNDRPRTPPRSHAVDPDLLPPGRWS